MESKIVNTRNAAISIMMKCYYAAIFIMYEKTTAFSRL